MVKKLLLLVVLLQTALTLKAQVPDPCPSDDTPAADFCEDACIYCNFNGYTGSTAGYSGQTPAGFCGTIENEQWLGFIAGATGATFTATASNCDIGNGVQIALYQTCSGTPVPNGCNGGMAGGANTPVSITVSLTPGVNYYLLIDGYAGDQCDFTITVTPPSAAQAPSLGNAGAIQAPAKICPGGNMTVSIPPVPGAGGYNWTATGGASINGQGSSVQTLAPGGNVVTVTAPPNAPPPASIQVCVQPVNSCDMDNPFVCKTILIQKIPDTQLPPTIVCAEDAPYELPWGDFVNTPGTQNYSHTYTSYQGCDSIVKKTVTIKTPIIKNLSPQTICAGSCITICGEEYCDGGQFQKTCQSYQGCDSLVNFSILILSPVADIIGGGTLSCVTNSIVLNSAPSPGAKFWKILPTGVTVGTGNTYTVTQPGTYILSVSASAGGNSCVSTDTIVITGNTTPPTVSATGGVLGCGVANSIQLSVTTNATNPTYAWSGPNGFTSTSPTPTVTQPGAYIVTVTSQSNGCTNTATATVTGNTTPPSPTATGGTLTCALTTVTLNSTPGTGVTYSWSGPNGFTSTIQNPPATAAGNYTVTVTNNSNNCTATATATVNLNNTPPPAAATVSGPITCPTPVVNLSATPASGATYSWSGPNGFTSTSQNPTANAAGAYIVTVTANSNGCTAAATVNVSGDTNLPNATATGGTVTCGAQSIVINGGSTTPGVSFSWTGPGGFTSNQQNPTVNTVGTYTLTVSNPANSCSSTATAAVAGDFAAPNAAATGGIITCSSSSTTISGSSTTNGATFAWAGPGGFTSNLQSPTVSSTGLYTLTVTNPVNGCTSTATATVSPDANVPNATAAGGTITCSNTSVTLNGGSVTPGATLSWSGPNGFTSTLEDPTVSLDGIYTLTVLNPANGCTAQATATVDLDNDDPGASATGGTLTCAAPSFTLGGSSPTNGVTWLWSGPNNFSSTQQSPSVANDGTYTLTVTNPSNGCTSAATAVVAADQNAPVAASTTGTLTCSVTSIVLNGSANQIVTYAWSGPGNFTSTAQNPSVNTPGDYLLTVTSTGNGCTDAITVPVAQDIVQPGASSTGNTIDCSNPQVPISASSSTTGVTYAWSGPGNFTSASQNPGVSLNGNYTVTVTNPTNGCTSTSTALVQIDTVTAVLQASAPTTLTCAVTTVNIEASVNPSGSTLQGLAWSGPGGFASTVEDPAVTAPGVYTLLATLSNGCTSQVQTTVNQDITAPNVGAQGGTLTCATTTINLDGSSSTTGATFAWTGPNNFSSTAQDPPVTVDGIYSLTVTGPNGCTSSTTATVALDVVEPGAVAVSSNNLDCDELTTNLTGTSPTNNATFAWAGPGGFTATTAVATASNPGTYTVTTTGPNGCTSVADVIITQDITAPGASASGDTTDCISGQATLSGNSPTAGVSWLWAGPNNYSSTQQNPVTTVPGAYNLTVTGLNGCTSVATANVAENNDSPEVALSGGGTLTCAVTDLVITGTISTPGATGIWTGPNNFTSTQNTITVTIPGVYLYTVTALNGCISAPSSTIPQDIVSPQGVTASGGLLNCTFPSITLQGSSSTAGVNYNWSGPGGFVSPQQNPAVTNPGTYTLVVTNPVNGCTTEATTEVTQDPTVPDISVQADSLTCTVQAVTLQATTSTPNVTFQWTGPNGFTSTLEDPSVSIPGSYTVVAKAISGCTSTFAYNVTQNINAPGATAQGDTLTCTVPTGIISGGSQTPGVSYSWAGPGGFTSNVPNPTVTQTGTYTLTTTSSNGCTSTATAQVVPDQSIPQINITTGTITCAVASIQLTATSSNVPNATWKWSGPGNFTSTQSNPTVTVPGNYTVIATAPNGCSATTGGTVADDTDGPAVNVGTPDELNCTTTQVALLATVPVQGSYLFQWNTQNGNILSGANTQNPQVSQAGIYTVVVTNNSNGCTTSEDVEVEVNPATPSGVALQEKDVSCYGSTDGLAIIDSVAGGTPPFVYSLDNLAFTTGTLFNGLGPGVHSLLIQDANGCEFETTFELLEPEELTVTLGPDTTVLFGQSISLSLDQVVNYPDRVVKTIVTPQGVMDSILCDSCDEFRPLYSFRYHVTVLDSNGCKATDDRLVIVDKTRYVYIPNIFKPDSPSENSIFTVFGNEDQIVNINSLQVFDRWGGLVFENFDFQPNDLNSGWDGMVRGDKANPAVFVYYAEILFIDGETVLYKGDVMLYR
ncbi:MAG TPA: gliding motility-associated C-terminal domain-containing protein [Saprospiraceae bacterium]|nr:gliding motility-associated C-terminal domain-containing protein [Saprospiraceae bacterium]